MSLITLMTRLVLQLLLHTLITKGRQSFILSAPEFKKGVCCEVVL